MSHCANYILVLDGKRRIANSRWGSKALTSSLAYGPEEGLAFLLDATSDGDEESNFVYGELMCEGAVLADFDQRQLLVFGGEDLRYEKPLQHAYVSLLRRAWDGWRVDWAHGGWPEIARAAALELHADEPRRAQPLDAVVAFEPAQRSWGRGPDGRYDWTDDPDAWSRPIEASRLYFNRGGPLTVVTVRDRSGRVRHYQLGSDHQRVLETGPALVVLLRDIQPVGLSPASNAARGGLLIDEQQQRIQYWVGAEARSWLAERMETAWPGWGVVRQDGGLPRQLELADDDPRRVEIPLAVLRQAVVEQLLGDSGDDGGIALLVEEIRKRATEPNVVVAAGATQMPPRGRLSKTERAEFLARMLVQPEGG